MKSLALSLLAATLSFAGASAHAELKGTADFSASKSSLSSPYPNAHSESASVLFDLDRGHKFGVGITSVDAWGGNANYLAIRSVNPVSETAWFDSNIGASDKDRITVRSRVGTMFNQKFPSNNVILGVGLDWYDMRTGGASTTLNLQGVYYVPNHPLVLQANAAYAVSEFGSRGGLRTSVAATYGRVGQWTVTGTVGTGRVHYELTSQPGTVADYNSDHASVGVRYWMAPNWGVTANLGRVQNRVYERTELRGGVFVSF